MRYVRTRKNEDKFLKKNSDWPKGIFTIPKVNKSNRTADDLFQDLSERSKRRKRIYVTIQIQM